MKKRSPEGVISCAPHPETARAPKSILLARLLLILVVQADHLRDVRRRLACLRRLPLKSLRPDLLRPLTHHLLQLSYRLSRRQIPARGRHRLILILIPPRSYHRDLLRMVCLVLFLWPPSCSGVQHVSSKGFANPRRTQMASCDGVCIPVHLWKNLQHLMRLLVIGIGLQL